MEKTNLSLAWKKKPSFYDDIELELKQTEPYKRLSTKKKINFSFHK